MQEQAGRLTQTVSVFKISSGDFTQAPAVMAVCKPVPAIAKTVKPAATINGNSFKEAA